MSQRLGVYDQPQSMHCFVEMAYTYSVMKYHDE